jgi:hypothetical protein
MMPNKTKIAQNILFVFRVAHIHVFFKLSARILTGNNGTGLL